MAGRDEKPELTLDDAEELRQAIGDSVRAIRRSESTPEGQIEALGFLMRDGAHSIATLARLRRVRHQTMRVTITELEAQGLAERAPDPADARGVLISLTRAGRQMITEARARRSSRVLDAAQRSLSAHERAVLAEAAGALRKLARALESDGAP
jgi:DNA-binding MarR family transcriptional regulator